MRGWNGVTNSLSGFELRTAHSHFMASMRALLAPVEEPPHA